MGLLRLRKCSGETFRPELKGGVSVVRELHVYGSVVPVNARDPSKFQHQVGHNTDLAVYFYPSTHVHVNTLCTHLILHMHSDMHVHKCMCTSWSFAAQLT